MTTLLSLLRRLALILFWPGVAVIAWGELTPHPPADAQLVWDKAEHFTAYFGLALMAALVLGRTRRLAYALAGILILAGLLEILQGYTGRDPEWTDMLANSLGWMAGALVGLGLVGGIRRD
jgi:VanZ family protein